MHTATYDRAAREWFTRPPEQRFETLEALEAATRADAEASRDIAPIRRRDVDLCYTDGSGLTMQLGGRPYRLTDWSFGQLCQRLTAPAGFLKSMRDGRLVADVLRHRVTQQPEFPGGDPDDDRKKEPMVRPYVHTGNGTVRALTGPAYGRILHCTLVQGLQAIRDRHGWTNPPEWGGKPSGLFYGDRTMFAMLIDDRERSIVTHPAAAKREELGRFLMVYNSEEGNTSFGLTVGWFRYVCGNLMVWGVENVREFRTRHTSNVRNRIRDNFRAALATATSPDARRLETDAIRFAIGERIDDGTLMLASGEKAVLDGLAPIVVRRTGLNEATVRAGLMQGYQDGEDVRTAWGALQGLTSWARDREYQDATVSVSRQAARGLLPKLGRKALTA